MSQPGSRFLPAKGSGGCGDRRQRGREGTEFMGQMGESLRDAFLCGGISEEASAVRVSERISERQAEPVVDKTKERYAVEKDPEVSIVRKAKPVRGEEPHSAGWLMLEYSKRGRTATDGSVLGDPNYAS